MSFPPSPTVEQDHDADDAGSFIGLFILLHLLVFGFGLMHYQLKVSAHSVPPYGGCAD